MIRITTQVTSSQTVVTIDGRVEGPDLKEMQRVRRAVKGEVLLNLRGLDGGVPDGIRLLQDWLEDGAQIEATTPFLVMMLRTPTPKTHSAPGSKKQSTIPSMKHYRKILILTLTAAWLGLPVRPAAAQNIQDAIEVVRSVMKADRQAIVAAALQLTEAESLAFWPIYHEYRADMDQVSGGLVALVLDYAKAYPDIPEDRAKAMLKELGNLEKELVTTRNSYLRKVGRVLPAGKTLRFAQVESRLDLAIRLELAANIPLAPVAQ